MVELQEIKTITKDTLVTFKTVEIETMIGLLKSGMNPRAEYSESQLEMANDAIRFQKDIMSDILLVLE